MRRILNEQKRFTLKSFLYEKICESLFWDSIKSESMRLELALSFVEKNLIHQYHINSYTAWFVIHCNSSIPKES